MFPPARLPAPPHQAEVQKRTTPVILLEGNDCIVQSETGSGKTLSFLMPLLSLLRYPPQLYTDDLKASKQATPTHLRPALASKPWRLRCQEHSASRKLNPSASPPPVGFPSLPANLPSCPPAHLPASLLAPHQCL